MKLKYFVRKFLADRLDDVKKIKDALGVGAAIGNVLLGLSVQSLAKLVAAYLLLGLVISIMEGILSQPKKKERSSLRMKLMKQGRKVKRDSS